MLRPSQLILVASDLGQPVPYETMQPLQVALEDIDDNEPLFVRPPVSVPRPCTGHAHTGPQWPQMMHTLPKNRFAKQLGAADMGQTEPCFTRYPVVQRATKRSWLAERIGSRVHVHS